MSICLKCKERFMCDRILYDCPRNPNDMPTDKDELSEEQITEWKQLIEKQRRKANEAL